MPLNRSRIAVLLLTIFALTVLGIAAGTLQSAHPQEMDTSGTGGESGTSGGQGAMKSQPSTGDSSSTHFFLPELDATNSLQDERARSGSVLARLAFGVILLLLGATLLLWHFTSGESTADIAADNETQTLVDEQTPCTPPPDAQNVPATNDIYRAWQAMIAALDVDVPDSKTPAELAEIASNAGFPESKVDTLTEMFCDVRYGGTTPSTEQEEHAREVLETIRQATQPAELKESDSPAEQ